jgi:hypothetical protein
MRTRKILIGGWLVLGTCALAWAGAWFRVACTQEVVLVEAKPSGELVWTNHPDGGTARVEVAYWADGYWDARVPLTNQVVSGDLVRVTQTLGAVPASHMTCSHQLHKLVQAKARFFADNPDSPSVALFNLIPAYLDEVPVCPDGGFYMLGNKFTDPTCSFAASGHTI